jgi:DNA-binding IclR family transcriptional regulator
MNGSKAAQIEDAFQKSSDFATTLAKGIAILESFSAQQPILSPAQLSAATGLKRPTVARLAFTLTELGYLIRVDGGYRLALRSLPLIHPLLAGMSVRQMARPLMQELASDVRGNVSIGALDGCNLVYVETARSADTGPHIPDIGSSVPVLRTALGRALFSMLPQADRSALKRRFENEASELWRELGGTLEINVASCADRGFTFSYGDLVQQTYAVAAPLFHDPAFGYFAVNCGIPAFRLRKDQLEGELGPRIAKLAASICAMCNRPQVLAEPWLFDNDPKRRRNRKAS